MLEFLALLTILGNILILLLLLSRLKIGLSEQTVEKLGKKYGLYFAFLVSLLATTGSLYLSEVRGVTPCLLCWYQRIFMYPQVLILAIALIMQDLKVGRYILPLSLVGGLIAAYHYYIQQGGVNLISCSIQVADCTQKFKVYFGFITVPYMALTAFALIAISTGILYYSKISKS